MRKIGYSYPHRRNLAALALAVVLAGCADAGSERGGSAAVTGEPQAVESFRTVKLAVPGELVLTKGSSPEVTVSGDPEDVANVVVDVRNGVLHLESEEDSWSVSWGSGEPALKIAVTYTELEILRITGSGDARIDAWSREQARVEVAGSGSADVTDIDVDQLTLSISGSGDIEVSGQASELVADIAGSGDIEAFELASQSVKASIAGSGDIKVSASAHLRARIAGSGDVRYRGEPDVSEQILGSGSVEPASALEL